MEATTTRASIVIRSIPTREILTHASMTMPLSSTRSRTSIKLVPPGALSTAICFGSFSISLEKRAYCARFDGASLLLPLFAFHATGHVSPCRDRAAGCGKLSDLQFEFSKPFAQLEVFGFGTLRT